MIPRVLSPSPYTSSSLVELPGIIGNQLRILKRTDTRCHGRLDHLFVGRPGVSGKRKTGKSLSPQGQSPYLNPLVRPQVAWEVTRDYYTPLLPNVSVCNYSILFSPLQIIKKFIQSYGVPYHFHIS